MAVSPELDELDQRLVAALHIVPRASFDDLSGVLGVDSSTIGRRFGRLHDEQILRVVGQVEWAMFSTTMPVHLFVATSGIAPSRVCDGLLAIPQIQHLVQTSGTHAIFATAHAASEERTAQLIDQMYDVAGVASMCILPVLAAVANGRGAGWEPMLLTDTERARCRELGTNLQNASEAPPVSVEPVEREIIRMLQQDGRASAAGLGRALGLAPSTAHRIVRRVLDNGWVRPRVEIAPELLGFATPFVLRVEAATDAAEDVVAQLTALPQTRYTTRVAGQEAVVCTGLVTDRSALGEFMDRELSGIEGIRSLQVDLVIAERRRYWMDRATDHGLTKFEPPPLLADTTGS